MSTKRKTTEVRPQQHVTTNEQAQLVAQIAETLGETDPVAMEELRRIVVRCGEARAQAWLEETIAIESAGGLMLPDGSRRRTPGGVYFQLVQRAGLPKKDRAYIFAPGWRKLMRWQELKPLGQGEHVALAKALRPNPGEARNVKITLIGKPGRVIEKRDVAMTTMKNDKPSALPKGMPSRPTPAAIFTVYIALKQWRKVAAAVQAGAKLVVEGWPAYDPELEGVALWVTNCTARAAGKAASDTA